MRQVVSTRRVKVMESRARTQALLLFVVAAIIMVVFVVVVVPAVFNWVVSRSQQKPTPASSASAAVLPQQPAVDSLPTHTKMEEQTVKGYTSAAAQVLLLVDGQEVQQQKAAEDGSFSFTIKLVEGEHAVAVVAANDEGGRSTASPDQKVQVDVTVPVLTITAPSDGANYTLPRERVVAITGKVSEEAVVFINGMRANTTGDDHTFSGTIQLGNGSNEVKVTAQDEAGNSSPEQVLRLNYNP